MTSLASLQQPCHLRSTFMLRQYALAHLVLSSSNGVKFSSRPGPTWVRGSRKPWGSLGGRLWRRWPGLSRHLIKEVPFRSLFVSFEVLEDLRGDPSCHVVLNTLHALPRAGGRHIVADPAHTGHSRFHVRWSHAFFQRLISWTRFYALMKKGSSNPGNQKRVWKWGSGTCPPLYR